MTAEPYANWRERARTDPQGAQEIWAARYELAVQQFMASAISHEVFVASLYALGFRGSELEAERRLREQQKFEQTGDWR